MVIAAVSAVVIIAIIAVSASFGWHRKERRGFMKFGGFWGQEFKGSGRGFGPGFGHKWGGGSKGMMKGSEISDETKQLFEDMRSARKSGDEAKVKELGDKIKTARDAEMAVRETALETALAGGYEAWKTYAAEQKIPQAEIDKVTADNFADFVALNTVRKQIRELEQKLGLQGCGFFPMPPAPMFNK